jgi:hypothetical protein
VAGRSRYRVALCVVCTVRVETRSAGFLVEPQNQGLQFVSGLTSNHSDDFLWFGLKTTGNGFLRFVLKIGGDGFCQFGLKTCYDGF